MIIDAALILQCALLLGLVALSAFFSGSETALFSVSRARLMAYREDGDRVHGLIASMMDSYHSVLSTLILGNMLVNSGISMLDEEIMGRLSLGEPMTSIVSLFTSIVILLICGEVAPKNVAIMNPEGVSGLVARPVWLLQKLLRPLTKAVEYVCDIILDLLGRRRSKALSPAEYKSYLMMSAESGVFSSSEVALLSEALALRESRLSELMVSRVSLKFLRKGDSPEDVAAAFRSAKLRFLPLAGDQGDDSAESIVSARGFLLLESERRQAWWESEAVVPAVFVPQSSSVTKALSTMRRAKAEAALSTDEYGGISGMVTLNRIYSEMLGDVSETGFKEKSEADIGARTGSHSWSFDGKESLEKVSGLIGFQFPRDIESRTLNGMLQERLGKIPEAGDSVELKGLVFKVERATPMKAERVSVTFSVSRTAPVFALPHERGGG